MLKSAGTCMTYKGSGLVKLEHPLLRATKPTWHVYMRLLSHCPSGSAQHEGGTAWTAQDQASLMAPAVFFSIFLLPLRRRPTGANPLPPHPHALRKPAHLKLCIWGASLPVNPHLNESVR